MDLVNAFKKCENIDEDFVKRIHQCFVNLAELHVITNYNEELDKLIGWTIDNNKLDVMILVFKYFTSDNIMKVNSYANGERFRKACQNGHMDIVEYFVENMGITKDDVSYSGFWAFCLACGNGQLEVARYLVKTFDITIDDVRDTNYDNVVWHSYTGKQLNSIKYLVEEIGFTVNDIREHINGYSSCAEIDKWLNEMEYTDDQKNTISLIKDLMIMKKITSADLV